MLRFEDQPVAGVTGTTAWNAVALMLFWGDFPSLASAVAAAADGDPSQLGFVGAAGEDPALLDSYAAVNCADLMGDRGRAAWEASAAEIAAAAPRSGPFLAYAPGWGSVECAFWPVALQREPSRISAAGAPPILVVSATGDPATPHAWAESLAEQLDSGVLLTREGEGHTSYPASPCIVGFVDRYLVSLDTPPAGTTCPAPG
jgi:hypothetical protein